MWHGHSGLVCLLHILLWYWVVYFYDVFVCVCVCCSLSLALWAPCKPWYHADIFTIAHLNSITTPGHIIFCLSYSKPWHSGFQDCLGCTRVELSLKLFTSIDKILKIQNPAVLWCHLLFHGFIFQRDGRTKKSRSNKRRRGKDRRYLPCLKQVWDCLEFRLVFLFL